MRLDSRCYKFNTFIVKITCIDQEKNLPSDSADDQVLPMALLANQTIA